MLGFELGLKQGGFDLLQILGPSPVFCVYYYLLIQAHTTSVVPNNLHSHISGRSSMINATNPQDYHRFPGTEQVKGLCDLFNTVTSCPFNADFQPPTGHGVKTTAVLENLQHKFFLLMLFKRLQAESLCFLLWHKCHQFYYGVTF